jgi:hypothetical protein
VRVGIVAFWWLVRCFLLGMLLNDQDDVNELQDLVGDYSGAC